MKCVAGLGDGKYLRAPRALSLRQCNTGPSTPYCDRVTYGTKRTPSLLATMLENLFDLTVLVKVNADRTVAQAEHLRQRSNTRQWMVRSHEE
jgi:hypothetical protein